ncbi:MAG TPA: type IV pilus biogenesis/stability protein PilW [Chromatiaceae bacterium]|jgi:type IV pilus assembly protein PilF|nr:type IV pilus biogenesis/stability protein PilW [Chromatiaceae bacterium]HIN82758.1 type IV pilus biogenesis/stability protein PilW [Chromatiales bacterium]HIA08377.1 type IV pilus biogenesis/stability protein PilW [Chromatiaceae bacterium]HIB84895.1 type IV pilus biogenesis/stability protein PilW [Chromatiaceae bacterium]HIO14506.1 type IV pilus biogenesis/stability protein PilW [Chromatiales bacterium]
MIRLFPLILVVGAMLSACTAQPVSQGPGADNAADTYVQLGVSYLREGRLEASLDRLQRALAISPNMASAHDAIATLYEHLGELEKAEKHFRRSVKLAPDTARGHNNYGRFLCALGEMDPAQEQFSVAYNNPLYQRPWVALTNAGVCELKAGDEIEAERLFRRALQRNPMFAATLGQMLALTFQQKSYLSARGYLQRYWEVAPRSAQSLWIGIQTEEILGDVDAVASYALLLKAKFPDSEQVMLLRRRE